MTGLIKVNLGVVCQPRTDSRGPETMVTIVASLNQAGDARLRGGGHPAACICLESDGLLRAEPMGEFLDSTGLNSLKYLFSFNFGFRFLRF